MPIETQRETGMHKASAAFSPLAGKAALVLICVAAAGLTWSYLSDVSSQAAAAEVAAEAPAPSPPPAIDTTAFKDIALSAKSAIVVDETDGRTLYELHPDAQWPLASLTKVALTLAVSQVLPADTVITIPFNTGYNSHAGGEMQTGERWKLQEVIDFTLAVSSNEGADILATVGNDPIHEAYPLSPPASATLWRMNAIAKQLGLMHTYFLNDNGLDESLTQSGAYGSARDIATLFAYAATSAPQTFAATIRQGFNVTSVDGKHLQALNTDEALPSVPNAIMGKTGYTDLAGGNLAVCFTVKSRLICAVVLGSTYNGRFTDMEHLVGATQTALASTTS